MKKKITVLILALVMIFSIVACNKTTDNPVNTPAPTNTPAPPSTTTPDNKPPTGNQPPSGSPSPTGGEQPAEPPAPSVHPSANAKLRIAFASEPSTLTQPGFAFAQAATPGYIFGETLLGWDSERNDVRPKLATSWEWVDDLTLRLKLREDVTSIAGDPFTASDVVYTFKLNNETTTMAAYYNFFDYEKTKAVDKYTVDLVLKRPYPFLIADLAHNAYIMCVEKSHKAISNPMEDPSSLTGAYRLVNWRTNEVVIAERRDDYWGDPPYYKTIEIWTVTDTNTRTMGVEAGDFDFAWSPLLTAIDLADGVKTKAWHTPTAGRYQNFQLNTDNEHLAIKEVRQAIALAINYEALLKIANNNNGVFSDASCFSPYNPMAYTPPTPGKPNFLSQTNVEKAKQLLADAGFPGGGFTIDCVYRPQEAQTATSAELLKNQLGQIGITLELRPCDNATFFEQVRAGTFDTHISVAGNPNPKRCMSQLDPRIGHNAASGSCGEWYPNSQYLYDLVDKCLFTVDDAARYAAFTEFNDLCREYVPQIILYCPYASNFTSGAIDHIELDIMGSVNLAYIWPADYITG